MSTMDDKEQTAEAVVKVLRAEVRVLSVGSRQITASVARQLDEVDLSKMEPWGRVSLGSGARHVIGRHKGTGALVVASYSTSRGRTFIGTDVIDQPIKVCDKVKNSTPSYGLDMSYEGRGIRVTASRIEKKECGYTYGGRDPHEDCRPVLTPEQSVAISKEIAEWDAIHSAHVVASKLPLIILAGLR